MPKIMKIRGAAMVESPETMKELEGIVLYAAVNLMTTEQRNRKLLSI